MTLALSPLARAAAALVAVPALAVLTGSSAATPAADAPDSSPAVQACEDDSAPGWSARVRAGAKQPEPPKYAAKEAKKYKKIEDAPRLEAGSVSVQTVVHVITAEPPTAGERAELEQQVDDQVAVLNASYAGETVETVDEHATGGTDTPFRFDLAETTWTVSEEWAVLSPGKEERKMKQTLHRGDARTLNVYVTRLSGDLLGFAYFPGVNQPKYLDGVVVLDGTLPGGYARPYDRGDTLVHEVGHWLALEHTFEGGCSEENDGVEDTPAEAEPQFECPVGADSCEDAPGLDPIHNFMDYVDDDCMYEFTPGQAGRMSDAWLAFRADGKG